jgi:D-xylose 1-dehydrogenase (NADP+, D-xylono-1,5-lactone-forming)
MDTKNKLRWGILGYARIARVELMPAILRSSNSEIAAIASRGQAKLDECAKAFPNVRTLVGYDNLVSDPGVDAVYIPLPNSQHSEWTIKAAEHGKHVLCEKPIAMNAAECRAMMAACAKHGVTFMEAFMYRYTDRVRQVMAVLKSGALGDVKFISSSFRFLLQDPDSFKLAPELGGGSLYDVGCYPINFIGMVADFVGGGPATAVPESVAVECVMKGGVDHILSAVLKYPTGLIATLSSGFNAHGRVFTEIVGTKGFLEIPDTFFGNSGQLRLTTAAGTHDIAVAESDRYRLEVEDFAGAVLEKRTPVMSLAETLRNAELIDRLLAAR